MARKLKFETFGSSFTSAFTSRIAFSGSPSARLIVARNETALALRGCERVTSRIVSSTPAKSCLACAISARESCAPALPSASGNAANERWAACSASPYQVF